MRRWIVAPATRAGLAGAAPPVCTILLGERRPDSPRLLYLAFRVPPWRKVAPMRRHAVVLALVLALSAFGGSAVEASPITYYFSGTVAYAFGSLDPLTGTPFYGQLLYDPAWPTNDGLKYSIPAGAFSLTTANGKSVSTPGFVFAGIWGISTDMGMWFDPVFDGSSALGAASFALRGPSGSSPGGSSPPPLPSDLTGFSFYHSLRLSGRETPGAHGGGVRRRLLHDRRRRMRGSAGARARVSAPLRNRTGRREALAAAPSARTLTSAIPRKTVCL